MLQAVGNAQPLVLKLTVVGMRKTGIRFGIVRIEFDRAVEAPQGKLEHLLCIGAAQHSFTASQKQVMCFGVGGWNRSKAIVFGCREFDLERVHYASGQIILNGKNIRNLAIISFSPEMHAALRINQLGVYANTVSRTPNRTIEDVAHAKVATNLPDIWHPSLVNKARVAGYDKQTAYF